MKAKPLALRIAALLGASVVPHLAFATDQAQPPVTNLSGVDVEARLDEARNSLAPDTGSSQYVIDQKTIAALPLGASTAFNQVILQAPGVVQDSFGQLHVRGDHANLQYRIDGVTIPESIGGFGKIGRASCRERVCNDV